MAPKFWSSCSSSFPRAGLASDPEFARAQLRLKPRPYDLGRPRHALRPGTPLLLQLLRALLLLQPLLPGLQPGR